MIALIPDTILHRCTSLESYFFLTAMIYCSNRRCICLIGGLGWLAGLNTHHIEYQTKYSNDGLEAIWISKRNASAIFWLCPQWPPRSARQRPCQGHNGAVNGIDYMTETWAHTPAEESFLIFKPNLKKRVWRLLVFLCQPVFQCHSHFSKWEPVILKDCLSCVFCLPKISEGSLITPLMPAELSHQAFVNVPI